MKRKIFLALILTVATGISLFAQAGLNDPDNPYALELNYEAGAVKVLKNTIQIGTGGTDFDFVTQGGEEILFPIQRFTGNLTLGDRHNIVLLYQPLEISTKVDTKSDIIIDTNTFPSGDNLLIKYGFPFWRLSYVYDFISTDNLTLGAGLSLQLRNASIVFESLTSGDLTTSQNLGPVPIIKTWGSYRFDNGLFAGFEVDGFYAKSSFFNGADFEFEGSILDASVRVGLELREETDAYLNVRFLGGSAAGTSEYVDRYWTESVSSYTTNYLSSLSLSLGFTLR